MSSAARVTEAAEVVDLATRRRLVTPSRVWAVCTGCREGALAVLTARGVVGVEAIT